VGKQQETGDTPLGVTYTPEGSRFAVFAEADRVRIRLTNPGTRAILDADLAPMRGERGVFGVELEGDYRGWSYAYEIERDGQRLGDIIDPYARLIRTDRAYVCADATEITPRPALEPRDAIIYELHIRDFTRDPESGVRPQWQGKYLGLTQTGTRYDGTSLTTGLDHILELGATVVQLMPVHAFAMPYDPEYEWGYMPNDYNAPHPGYASGVELEAPVREFKRLVSALHEHGLRVTLDVVYNHDAEKWPGKLRSLMALAPREYFRWQEDGSPYDGSACGNEFRSESPMGRRFLVESVKYWVEHYGIDGYRFDLMGLIDEETMALVASELHAIDPTILVYGEPWAGGPAGIEINSKGKQRSRGWSVFNDEIRDGLRGRVFDLDDTGFLNAGTDVADVKSGIVGGITSFADGPMETINYIECHDNHTLEDRLELVRKRKASRVGRAEFDRMSRLGVLTLMTSQGIPFIHSGQEFGRQKAGEDNTYNLGDQINNIRWADKDERYRRFRFYRDAIAMRSAHPMFRLTRAEDIKRAVRFLDDDLGLTLPEGTIGFQVDDVHGTDEWSAAVVVLNGSPEQREIPLPEAPGRSDGWHVATLDGRFGGRLPDGARRAVSTLSVQAHSGAVLYVGR
jgi:pullulanase